MTSACLVHPTLTGRLLATTTSQYLGCIWPTVENACVIDATGFGCGADVSVTELTHIATVGYEMTAYTGVVEIPPATPRHRPSYRTRVRSPTPDPAPTRAPPAHGNIVSMTETRELTKHVRQHVFVRSPRRTGLTRILTSMGAAVFPEPGHGLSVTGMDAWTIASAAAAHYIPIQELTPRRSPEDAYLEAAQTR